MPHTERPRKRQATPDQQVAAIISEGTYLGHLLWAATSRGGPHTSQPTPPQHLKALYRGLSWAVEYSAQLISMTPTRRATLENGFRCGPGGWKVYCKGRREVRSL